MKPGRMDKQALLSGSVLMTLGILTGAFGAHVVQDMLSPERYEVYQTAVEYHFYHALGLLLIGVLPVWLPIGGTPAVSGYCRQVSSFFREASICSRSPTPGGWVQSHRLEALPLWRAGSALRWLS